MTPRQKIKRITTWIRQYAKQNRVPTLVVGISGGIDSSVVSTLCALSGLPTIAVAMPIHQSKHTHSLSLAHGAWLQSRFERVSMDVVDLTPVFDQFRGLLLERNAPGEQQELAFANSRSRLRMMTLYQIAQTHSGIVVGTGNRVEDFGVGFFTKYGDGGVDISPIGDCMKTEVWDMGRELDLLPEIIAAPPTDGLWTDGRTDEDQLGMTYPALEQAMLLDESGKPPATRQQRQDLGRYRKIRERNLHKMLPIPVCQFGK